MIEVDNVNIRNANTRTNKPIALSNYNTADTFLPLKQQQHQSHRIIPTKTSRKRRSSGLQNNLSKPRATKTKTKAKRNAETKLNYASTASQAETAELLIDTESSSTTLSFLSASQGNKQKELAAIKTSGKLMANQGEILSHLLQSNDVNNSNEEQEHSAEIAPLNVATTGK